MIETKEQALGLCIKYERLSKPQRLTQYSAWMSDLDAQMVPLSALFDLAAVVAHEAGDRALERRCLKHFDEITCWKDEIVP